MTYSIETLKKSMDICQIPMHRRQFLEKSMHEYQQQIAELAEEILRTCNSGNYYAIHINKQLKEPELSLIYTCAYCLVADKSRQFFLDRGFTEDIWRDTIPDLNWHAHDGADGSYWLDTVPNSYGWHCTIISGDVIQLGRLQFQKIASPEDYPGLSIKKGDTLANMHIPANGPLDIDACKASLEKAREVLPPIFGKFNAFFCESWLLNPVYRKYLPPTSNIIRFQNLGTVFPDNNSRDRDAINRVFRFYHEDPLTDKPRTILQSALQQMILKGESLASGIMIIPK